MKSKLSLLGLLFITLVISFPLLAAPQVTASVSSNKVVKGDLFILTVSINDSDQDYRLDTRPLEPFFTVYRPSQSKRSEYINGDFSQQTTWKIRLEAKKLGKITIPALEIGPFKTEAIDINVIDTAQANENDDHQQNNVYLENSIDKRESYIGQSFIYTTKLYISENPNELNLLDPKFEGAEVSVLGKDINSQQVLNGLRYQIITRQYKITPTQAGKFEIDSPLLTGSLRKVVSVSDRQNRIISDPINVRGERLAINIKAIPEGYQGEWLISDDLRLLEDNDLSAKSYKVGEPITRSITLQIAAIDKDKLPNIDLNYPKSLRVYPDQDQLEEGQASGLNYGIRTIRHAIIADQEGTLTLPEIKLNWFNSRTNKAETAILPAQELTILPADKSQAPLADTMQTKTQQGPPIVVIDNSHLIYWQVAVVILLVIILLMTFYHITYRRTQKNNQLQVKQSIVPLNHHYLTLQTALKKNNSVASYSTLLNYAQYHYPSLKSLNELPDKTKLTDEQKQHLRSELQWLQLCCSDQSQHWQSTKLSELIKIHESMQATKKPDNLLQINP